jgi:LacI family transcriptional regulator
MSRSYTMRDVARLAGVSVGSVSAVINEKATPSAKLKERVRSAMEALDYQPDHVARSLKVRRTHTVGMVVPDISNPFYTELMLGAEAAARARRYSVILCNSSDDPGLESQCLNTLFSRRVDGVILAPADLQGFQDRLTARRFPVVLVDRIPPRFKGLAVVTNNLEAAYEGTRHLIELGHERLAIITGRLDLSNGIDRLEGFRKSMQEAHLPIRHEYVQHGDFRLQSGYERGLELFRLAEPPTAIFCCNNKMTLGLMRALTECGVPCPEQVSVLGFDDFDWAASFRPRLTTIAQPTAEIGKTAMELLLRKIESADDSEAEDPKPISLRATLHVRDSTAPPYRCTEIPEAERQLVSHDPAAR